MKRLRALLNVHSHFSFGAGVSSPRTLVRRAYELGYTHLALTDQLGVYGTAEIYEASREKLKPVVGATIPLQHNGVYPVVLLAGSRSGYAKLNDLITLVKQSQDQVATLSMLEAHTHDLHLLTGGRKGFLNGLLTQRKVKEATYILQALKNAFRDRLWVQLFHDWHEHDARRMNLLRRFALEHRVPVVAAPEVRYALPGLMPLHDVMTCNRLGITISNRRDDERPRNDCQAIPEPLELEIPFPEAVENANLLADSLYFDVIPHRLESPPARIPEGGLTADSYLESLCRERLIDKYPGADFHTARDRLERELNTLRALGFADFFLVLKEIMDFCRSRSILASGRGSAAASVICYLLGISHCDPLKDDLLFERFLHAGKRCMPDVDIDVSSSRRPELFDWIERRFPNSGMVCNKVTYGIKSAIQDVGRVLAIQPQIRNELSKKLGRDFGHLRPHKARLAKPIFDEVLKGAPVVEPFLQLLEMMEKGMVSHTMPHSGGWVLSRHLLNTYTPVERSTGDFLCTQIDKDDAEILGLMKVDLLSLRMLSAVERCKEEKLRVDGEYLDTDNPPDEPLVWAEVGRGDTLGIFQIESPGQQRRSTEIKPNNQRDLTDQMGLHRPGPIQAGTVGPYTNRKLGREKVIYTHPSLEPILGKSYGVFLFQEQLMSVAHHLAGFTWEDAHRFMKKVAKYKDEHELRDYRKRFVSGMVQRTGAAEKQAAQVFSECIRFTGFGFAHSHAASFARHTYTTLWLRYFHPAEYFAGVLSEEPGMYDAKTLSEEAVKRGVRIERLDINLSSFHYRVEKDSLGNKSLRPSLCSVEELSKEAAKEVVLERLQGGPFVSLQDAVDRTTLERDVLEVLARGGAFDTFSERQKALYDIAPLVRSRQPKQTRLMMTKDCPLFPELGAMEKIEWEYETRGLSYHRVHPLDLRRQELLELGATPMARLHKAEGHVRTAGLVIARQKPETARGFAFYLLEDGREKIQVVIGPDVWEENRSTLRDARLMMTEGSLQRRDLAWTLRAERVWSVAN
jgi:error-prone DNA polymerase